MYEIRYKDINPDTGDVSNDSPIAICQSENWANIIKDLIIKDYMEVESDPNRDFYIKETVSN
jgi:hypothetical protein